MRATISDKIILIPVPKKEKEATEIAPLILYNIVMQCIDKSTAPK